MHNAVLVLGAVLFALPVSVSAVQQEYPFTATIRGENIWLRVDPAEDTEIVGYLQRGDDIRVTGAATAADGDEFYPVEVVKTGALGWVRDLAVNLPSINIARGSNTGRADARTNRNADGGSAPRSAETDQRRARAATTERNVNVPAPAPVGEVDCENFSTQAEAQAYFDSQGWSAANDPHRLDQGGVPGVPCESLP